MRHRSLRPLPNELLDPAPPPVLITGMHNSGTSILAEILHVNGLFLQANMAHHESHFFSIYVNDELILGEPNAWARLPLMPTEQVLGFRERVGHFILNTWRNDYMHWGYDGTSPWGFKDPRLCVLLPLYLDLFPDAKIVVIRRDPDDVAASLSRRVKRGIGVMADRQHWKRLTLAYHERAERIGRAHHHYHEIAYEEFCTDPVKVAGPLFEYLDLEFTDRAKDILRGRLRTDRIGSKRELNRWLRRLSGRSGLMTRLRRRVAGIIG